MMTVKWAVVQFRNVRWGTTVWMDGSDSMTIVILTMNVALDAALVTNVWSLWIAWNYVSIILIVLRAMPMIRMIPIRLWISCLAVLPVDVFSIIKYASLGWKH